MDDSAYLFESGFYFLINLCDHSVSNLNSRGIGVGTTVAEQVAGIVVNSTKTSL